YPSSIIDTWPVMDVVVRTAGDPLAMLATVRERVKTLDANLPISTPRTMENWISTNASPSRLNATLMVSFALIAVTIAAIGVYGVLAYSVNRRTKELGLRMALGAERGRVLRLIIGDGLRVGLPGIAAGVVAAVLLSRYVDSLIYGVTARDP